MPIVELICSGCQKPFRVPCSIEEAHEILKLDGEKKCGECEDRVDLEKRKNSISFFDWPWDKGRLSESDWRVIDGSLVEYIWGKVMVGEPTEADDPTAYIIVSSSSEQDSYLDVGNFWYIIL